MKAHHVLSRNTLSNRHEHLTDVRKIFGFMNQLTIMQLNTNRTL